MAEAINMDCQPHVFNNGSRGWMTGMWRFVASGIAVGAILTSGVVHGIWTDRWKNSEELKASAERLPDLGMQLGDWQGRSIPVDPSQLGDVAGYLLRHYVNSQDGSAVTVFLVCGRPGPISEHTPDVCYRANGYQVSPPENCQFLLSRDRPTAEFLTSRLIKTKSADESYLRIYWSWTANGKWLVPDNPRLTFARQSALYKLYLIRQMDSATESLEVDPCINLMQRLAPELERILFTNSQL